MATVNPNYCYTTTLSFLKQLFYILSQITDIDTEQQVWKMPQLHQDVWSQLFQIASVLKSSLGFGEKHDDNTWKASDEYWFPITKQ